MMSLKQIGSDLRRAVLESGSSESPRVKELKQIIQRHGDKAIGELTSLLHDPDIRVSEAAADLLQGIPNESAYNELVAYALLHLKDPTGKTKSPGPGWRRLRAIGKSVLPSMSKAYASELPFETRLSMIHITQQIRDPAGIQLLEAALKESDFRLVEAAAEALGRVDGPLAYDLLVKLLDSENVQHCIGAIRGFKLLGDKAAVKVLLEVLLREDQPYKLWATSSESPVNTTLHYAAANTINLLTGEQLDGDVGRIRIWIETHPDL